MRTTLIAIGVLAALTSGCGRDSHPSTAAAVNTAAAARPSAPAPAPSAAGPGVAVDGLAAAGPTAPAPRRTTDPTIAVSNLDAQLDGAVRAYAAQPERLAFARRVVELRLVRAQLLGMTSEYGRALTVADDAVARAPQAPDAYLLRARVRAAVHRFADALADLEAARAHGGDAQQIAARVASAKSAVGAGDPADGLASADAIVAVHKSYLTLSDRAAALVALGRWEDADAAFAEAAAAYRDVSPFALAWVDFQRGLMWAESADRPDRARPFYEAAVARLPRYAVATVHLAELYAEAGETARAVALLEPLAEVAEDPEPQALLGELLLATGYEERGEALIAAAREAYDALLAELPEAFADHAAEFFAGPGGDLPRAVTLAERNLALRQTARAYGLAVRLAHAAGDQARACALAARARGARPTPNLEAILERTTGTCPPH